jgi:hypothetical protein
MARPQRAELLARFFPEITDSKGSVGDRSAAIRLNTLAAEAILADQIRLFDLGFERLGPGVLVNRLFNGAPESAFVALEDFGADHAMAERTGDQDTATFLGDVIDQLEGFNFEKGVMIMLIDNSACQLFCIDRDHPAKSIEAQLLLAGA